MFMFKKIISNFFFPTPLGLGIALLGLILLWFTSRQKTGKILVSVGLTIVTIFSYHIIAKLLWQPFKNEYHTVESRNPLELTDKEIVSKLKYVVVLGGGHTINPKLPITSQLGLKSMFRLVEGVRLYKKFPDTKLLLSGSGFSGLASNAEMMAQLAKELGVPEEDIVLETKSRDTKDQARFIGPMIGKGPFILVTSASHMPRSIAIFKKVGLDPIPCPIGYIGDGKKMFNPSYFFPRAKYSSSSENAIYEYLGLAWTKLRGQR